MEELLSIKIDQFEGPLDLLLYLIKKNEIDIYDINISKITEDYLEYLNKMEELKLDIASDYIVMAATLIKIKADYMLPRYSYDENIEDPRTPLVEQLIEYQKIKKASELFRDIESEARKLFSRTITVQYNEIKEEELSIIDLIQVFTPLIKKGLSLSSYRSIDVKKTISEKMSEIMCLFEKQQKVNFNNYLIAQNSMFEAILSFIAMLEMINKRMLKIIQEEQFDIIWLSKI